MRTLVRMNAHTITTLISLSLAAAPAWADAPAHHAHGSGTQEHAGHDMASMPGWLGAGPMTRDASGTSWQPAASPHEGRHGEWSGWSLMGHGNATLVYDEQGGPRGDSRVFSGNMVMGSALRSLGPGQFGMRSMLSLEPWTIGKRGYPELLQTGETANGRDELIDRQHPHDLFMELAGIYSVPMGDEGSAFLYAGLPGEPALGPPAFMHRFSAMDNPEAPLTHHWLDSTHITFGVLTAGYVQGPVKLDASVFRGREPDETRWDLETPRLDSYAGRLTVNPTPAWSLQVSGGHLDSPEQLEPSVDTDRYTASATYHHREDGFQWQTMLAWGLNMNDPGHALDGVLLESTVAWDARHTVFARAETVEKDELFPEDDALHGHIHRVQKLAAGYIRELPSPEWVRIGGGGLLAVHFLPDSLETTYGETPVSFNLFTRIRF